jgi:phosphate ABC transporter phosphate-binding protein
MLRMIATTPEFRLSRSATHAHRSRLALASLWDKILSKLDIILCNLRVEAGEKMRSQLFQPRADNRSHRCGKVIPLRCGILVVFLVFLHQCAAQTGSPLNRIHTIQVASMGEGASGQALRQRIVNRLSKSRRLQVVESQPAADVALRGTSSMWATGTISLSPHSKSASQTIYEGYLSVELVNKDGQTLWSYLVTPSHFRTASITDDLADQLVSRLLAAIQGGSAGSTSPSATPGPHVALHGAGSTLAAPLYRKWFQSSGMSVAYDAIGSEEGIKQLAEGTVDFAASDMPLTAQNTPEGLRVIQVPTVLGGVVPIYNLPGLGRPLRLTPQALAGIYSGAIRKWNDPRILESNRGAHLPNAEIAVVHRSDGSGTTFVWTSFLSLASPEWKSSVGSGAHVAWPTGTSAAGNDGVADLTQKTPNAIGYVELIYAIQHELTYAAVRNTAGEFIKADLASITAAASAASEEKGEDLRFSILNAPGNDAYPISTFTWLLVPVRGVGQEKKSAIADLLNWALTSGQKQCASLGYAPLTRQVGASELRALSAWKNDAGKSKE